LCQELFYWVVTVPSYNLRILHEKNSLNALIEAGIGVIVLVVNSGSRDVDDAWRGYDRAEWQLPLPAKKTVTLQKSRMNDPRNPWIPLLQYAP